MRYGTLARSYLVHTHSLITSSLLKRTTLEFQHFQVFDVFAVDHKPYGGANMVDSFVSGGAGIDVQQVVFRIVNDLQDM